MSIQIEIDNLQEKNREVQKTVEREEPDFAKYEPDIEAIKQAAEEYEFENLVVIGNGGSITSFRAYLYAFLDEVDVDVRPVTTMDPDFLNRLSRELEPEKTLVMPISKSGETASVIESLLYFIDKGYDVHGVTSDNDGALKQILENNEYGWTEHPDIGGRFTGLTETALVPAAFAGLEIGEIRKGGEHMYEKLSPSEQYNPALNIASALYAAEERGFENVFAPFYSTRMFGYLPLFIQLMHETVCKNGEGQTVSGDLGPEYQHHTNQRIFGGKEDIVPVFFRSESHEKETISVPDSLSDVKIRGRKLSDLDGNSLQESLSSEYGGVKKALDEGDRPSITITTTSVSHENMGRLVALMQYVAVYSAWLRGVDPFNQPNVERSKEIGFEQRFK